MDPRLVNYPQLFHAYSERIQSLLIYIPADGRPPDTVRSDIQTCLADLGIKSAVLPLPFSLDIADSLQIMMTTGFSASKKSFKKESNRFKVTTLAGGVTYLSRIAETEVKQIKSWVFGVLDDVRHQTERFNKPFR